MRKPLILRLLKIILGLTAGIVLLVLSIYSLSWYALTARANAYIEYAWKDKSYTISGEAPKLKGYPKPPEAEFIGSIQDNKSGIKLETPLLYYSGFPMTGQVQYFETPAGLKLSAPFLEQTLNIKFAALQVQVPFKFPSSNRKTDIENWQKSGTPFYIRKIVLKTDKVSAIGSGTIQLDENLQIKADIAAHITGMEALFDDMAKQYGEKSMAIARNLLNIMSKVDPTTGEKYFETTLRIQNRGAYFGPMRIATLPEIKWDEN